MAGTPSRVAPAPIRAGRRADREEVRGAAILARDNQ